jgi:hypothetical protein
MKGEEKRLAIKLAVECRQNGGTLEDAATAAGVNVSTIHRWKEKDARFAMQLRLARSQYKLGLIQQVKTRKPEFLLEKQFPKEFGKKAEELAEKPKFFTSTEDLAKRIHRLVNAKDYNFERDKQDYSG